MSGGVLRRYVGARRLSATKHMSLFQQPARECEIADPEGLASWITSGNGP